MEGDGVSPRQRVCVCAWSALTRDVCVCVRVQLPADLGRLHLADSRQVTHGSSSQSGCSVTSDSGSSSLSDLYQVSPSSQVD